jgi:hypothetical protein
MFFELEELKLMQALVKPKGALPTHKEAGRLTSSLTFRSPQETGHPKWSGKPARITY